MKLVERLGAAALILMLAGCGGDSAEEAAGPARDTTTASSSDEDESTAARSPHDSLQAGQAQAPAEPAIAAASPPAQPPAAYLQCRSCHSVEPGRHGIGPSLHGVAGAPAASRPGFDYSPALEASGIVWDRDALDDWLTAPMKLVPGTRMVIGVAGPEARKEIIDYLETLK